MTPTSIYGSLIVTDAERKLLAKSHISVSPSTIESKPGSINYSHGRTRTVTIYKGDQVFKVHANQQIRNEALTKTAAIVQKKFGDIGSYARIDSQGVTVDANFLSHSEQKHTQEDFDELVQLLMAQDLFAKTLPTRTLQTTPLRSKLHQAVQKSADLREHARKTLKDAQSLLEPSALQVNITPVQSSDDESNPSLPTSDSGELSTDQQGVDSHSDGPANSGTESDVDLSPQPSPVLNSSKPHKRSFHRANLELTDDDSDDSDIEFATLSPSKKSKRNPKSVDFDHENARMLDAIRRQAKNSVNQKGGLKSQPLADNRAKSLVPSQSDDIDWTQAPSLTAAYLPKKKKAGAQKTSQPATDLRRATSVNLSVRDISKPKQSSSNLDKELNDQLDMPPVLLQVEPSVPETLDRVKEVASVVDLLIQPQVAMTSTPSIVFDSVQTNVPIKEEPISVSISEADLSRLNQLRANRKARPVADVFLARLAAKKQKQEKAKSQDLIVINPTPAFFMAHVVPVQSEQPSSLQPTPSLQDNTPAIACAAEKVSETASTIDVLAQAALVPSIATTNSLVSVEPIKTQLADKPGQTTQTVSELVQDSPAIDLKIAAAIKIQRAFRFHLAKKDLLERARKFGLLHKRAIQMKNEMQKLPKAIDVKKFDNEKQRLLDDCELLINLTGELKDKPYKSTNEDFCNIRDDLDDLGEEIQQLEFMVAYLDKCKPTRPKINFKDTTPKIAQGPMSLEKQERVISQELAKAFVVKGMGDLVENLSPSEFHERLYTRQLAREKHREELNRKKEESKKLIIQDSEIQQEMELLRENMRKRFAQEAKEGALKAQQQSKPAPKAPSTSVQERPKQESAKATVVVKQQSSTQKASVQKKTTKDKKGATDKANEKASQPTDSPAPWVKKDGEKQSLLKPMVAVQNQQTSKPASDAVQAPWVNNPTLLKKTPKKPEEAPVAQSSAPWVSPTGSAKFRNTTGGSILPWQKAN